MADIDEAIELTKKAITITSQEDPHRGFHASTLGGHYLDRYARTKEVDDLTSSIGAYRFAVDQPSGFTRQRISAAATAMHLCLVDEELAYKVGHVAVKLVPLLSVRSLETSDRQYLMTQAVGLASHTAAAALKIGKTPLHALSLLELGRGVLGSSLEEMRRDVLELREKHPKLADDFVRLRDELDTRVATSSTEKDSDPVLNTRGHRRHDAGRAFDALVLEIRQEPGFDNSLGPLAEQEIQSASQNGPIVVINVSVIGCHAILIQKDQVRVVSLDDVSNDDISERAKSVDLGSIQTLEWLWDTITGPVLDALGFTGPPSGEDSPHVWWIPTGPLSKFPLHAPGRHEERCSETVIDRVISTYSPSIKALIHGRRRHSREAVSTTPAEALLVAMEHTPGHAKLPYAANEVASLHILCNSMSFKVVEPGRCKKDVVSLLKGCKIFHFAGHGYTDMIDPSNSHLCLDDEDDPLTVADLLYMNLHQYSPFLAYLSACGTGRVQDERFIDESIHLISACQLAGFRHVIGTMWEVKDEHCVDVAQTTYESLRDGGVTDETVGRGLHKATKMLRDRWLDAMDGDILEVVELGRALEEISSPVNPAVEDVGGVRRHRDVVICDKDNDKKMADWVPYVHFGVWYTRISMFYIVGSNYKGSRGVMTEVGGVEVGRGDVPWLARA